jgi:hypothetical protein
MEQYKPEVFHKTQLIFSICLPHGSLGSFSNPQTFGGKDFSQNASKARII